MQNKFKVIDESGDRKYFTIVPNYIVNHSTPYEQAIYLYMKRVAGEGGTCWTSAQEIAQKLGCSRNTIAKYRNKLLKRGWIQVVGIKKTGATNQPTPEYKIVDLWNLNNKFYQDKHKGSIIDTLPENPQKMVGSHQLVTSKVSRSVHKEEPSEEEHNELSKTKDSFTPLEEEIIAIDDDGVPLTRKGKMSNPRNLVAQRLQREYNAKVQKTTGIKTDYGGAFGGYTMLCSILKKRPEKEVGELLDWYLTTEKFEKFPQLMAALSANTLMLFDQDTKIPS